MKLKFYLIGFGMGALLATAILMISGGLNKTSMTDDEIMARARQLGMVESNSRLIDQSAQGISNAELSTNSIIPQASAGTASSEDVQASAASDASQDESAISAAGETENDADEDKSEQSISGDSAEDGNSVDSPEAPETGIIGEENAGTNTPQSDAEGSSKSETGTDTGTSTGTGTQSSQVIVTVPDGLYSEGVSELLQQAGAIDDAEAFNAYLIQSGRDRYISPGAKLIPAAATYEEVAQILSGR